MTTNPTPLTIGLVIDDSLDRPDGVQQHVLTLGRWLTGKGHTVHYLTSTTQRTDIPRIHSLAKNLPITFNGNRLGIPLPADRSAIRQLFTDVHFDVLHINMPYSPLLAGAIINAAPATTRIVGTFHIMPWSTLTKVGTHALGAIQRRQLTRFHEIIAVSQPAADFATTALHVTPTIIGNPVRMLGFNQAREAELNQSAELSANERVRIFFLGRLVERKGAGELLKAAVRLREITTTPFELVIAGKGPLFDTYLRYVAETGLDDITSFPGYIAEDDKPELLAAADIVALPSTGGESFGISVVEALAACRGAVIAGDNPGYRTVMDGLEDRLVDATDTEAFAQLLAHYVDNADARATASAEQHEAAQRFDVDYIGRRVLEIYTA